MRIHLAEVAPFRYDALSGDVRFRATWLVSSMHDLVFELHETPVAFEHMGRGDHYARWHLIFNEKQEVCEGAPYNPWLEYARLRKLSEDALCLTPPLPPARRRAARTLTLGLTLTLALGLNLTLGLSLSLSLTLRGRRDCWWDRGVIGQRRAPPPATEGKEGCHGRGRRE